MEWAIHREREGERKRKKATTETHQPTKYKRKRYTNGLHNASNRYIDSHSFKHNHQTQAHLT